MTQKPRPKIPSSRTRGKQPAPVQLTSSPGYFRSTLWPIVASLAVLVLGVYRAIDLRWISDDAFITMRYVKNFVEGHGLVYNIGEKVEGYTHFLWLLMLAAARATGFNPVDASMWLGIVSFAAILTLLLAISYREHKKSLNSLWLPLAAGLFAFNYDNVVWASGGLETSFYTLLILGAYYFWFYTRYSESQRLLLSGSVLALASLTRPDAVLFTATAAGLLVVRGVKGGSIASSMRPIATLLLPSIIIGVPYLAWKYYYYGDLLPLTYYAKSSGASYFGQGLYYIWLYFRVYFILGIALIASVILLWRTRGSVAGVEDLGSRWKVAGVASMVYLALFVARSGGDFMFARFIIPVVPFIAIVIETGVTRLPVGAKRYQILIGISLLAGVFLENDLRVNVLFHLNAEGRPVENWNLTGEGSTRGIADERWDYYAGHYRFDDVTKGTMEVYSDIGRYLEPMFRDLPVTIAIPGGKNMVAYYANFKTCINEYGLTDSAIAHSSSSAHGRIGHEKHATEEYLKQRHVDLELYDAVPNIPADLSSGTVALEIPTMGLWQFTHLVTYDTANMDSLSHRFGSGLVRIP
ncbi:MAG: hypothetical protein Q8922_06555 [Bacteroidota bacterium]|nr:hypothetical protein [Bacteroidota bacterium]MDP4232744.1 hypothetical protein [Bacteroidota bacterium]MDP4244060.1 hypothetical protein [Bacteroidota bacterium]MDP4287580.1 hypothetical protein [Bacteroidota bacterium]